MCDLFSLLFLFLEYCNCSWEKAGVLPVKFAGLTSPSNLISPLDADGTKYKELMLSARLNSLSLQLNDFTVTVVTPGFHDTTYRIGDITGK